MTVPPVPPPGDPQPPAPPPYGAQPTYQPAPHQAQPTYQPAPHQAQPTYQPATPPKQSNGLATAGFVLGLLGMLGSFIPVLNIGGMILGLVGAILAAVGLVKAKKTGTGKGLAITGIVLGVLAIIIAIVINVAFADAVDDAVDDARPSVEAPEATDDADGEGPADSAPPAEETEEPTEEPTVVVPLPPDANPAMAVVGVDSFPDGVTGELSVIAQAVALERSGALPVVVRNLTDRPMNRIEVTGTARDASGALVGSGSDQGFNPAVVGPGEIAIGYVYFGMDELPDGATFDLAVTGSDEESWLIHAVDLVVTEHNRTSDSVLVMLRNDSEGDVSGPIGLALMCFDDTGVPVSTHRAYAEPDEAAPGATVSASVDFYGDPPCERYIVSGSGYRR